MVSLSLLQAHPSASIPNGHPLSSSYPSPGHDRQPPLPSTHAYPQASNQTGFPRAMGGYRNNPTATDAIHQMLSPQTSLAPGQHGNFSEMGGDSKDLQQGMSDQELTALLSRQDIATSLAEDLLAQFGNQSDKAGGHSDASSQQVKGTSGQGPLSADPISNIETKPTPFSPTASGQQQALAGEGTNSSPRLSHSKSPATAPSSSGKPLQEELDWTNELKVETEARKGAGSEPLSPSHMSINMSASQIIAACKGMGEFYSGLLHSFH